MKYHVIKASTKEIKLETNDYEEADRFMRTSGALVLSWKEEAIDELNKLGYNELKSMGFSMGEEHYNHQGLNFGDNKNLDYGR